MSTVVAEGIATALETPPDELDRPLQRIVDTDALDSLFHDRYDRSKNGVRLLSFRTNGLEVTVREGREVQIYEVDD
ncbi:MAG: HalOD1 output domain-containing protein [Halalkalicoccus sp.]